MRTIQWAVFLGVAFILGGVVGHRRNAGARAEFSGGVQTPTTLAGREASPPASAGGHSLRRDLNPAEREAHLRIAFGQAGVSELAARVEQLLALRSRPQRDRELRLALEVLARQDPAAALDFAAREPRRPLRTFLVAGVVAGWMVHDPAEALSWAAAEGNAEYADAAFEQLAAFAPEEVLRLTESLPNASAEFRWNAYRAIVEARLLDASYPEAIALVQRAADPALRMWLSAQVADAWVRTEPNDAARWAATLPEGRERTSVLIHVGSVWAAQHPEAAADFTLTLPPGEARQQMLQHALIEWIGRDMAAASRWIDRLEPQPENDAAVNAIATDPTLIRVNPEIAWDWAESLAGREARRYALAVVARQWLEQQPEAARRRIETSAALSAEERDQLHVALDRPGPSR